MVVSLTYDQILRKVLFPVYKVDAEDFYLRDGLVLVNEQVLDDTNQRGQTVGARRLQTPHKLKKITKTYEEFLDIVRDNPTMLMDNNGKLFSYEKSKFEKIKSYRIKKKELKDTHTRIWLHEVNFAFIIPRPPLGQEWAQVLTLNNRPWLLWGFSETKLPETRRKI